MTRPAIIVRLEPSTGTRDANLTVRILGDNMRGVTECDMGAGIEVRKLVLVIEPEVQVEISIAADAHLGARDVTLTKEGLYPVTRVAGFRVE
jgi:hypothetical protein